ncbi:MAG: PorV/PorQ family protein [Bacteroidia bacterium]|nr:PorV/PorQ family protein [Bacteroidia bacterium]
MRKYSYEFLNIGVGAKALGMAGAQTSVVNDATAGYWNPSGLANMQDKAQLALMHSSYFAGIAKFDYGAFATRLDSQTVVSASFVRFGVDEIPNTIELIDANGVVDYSRISSFSIADNAFFLSAARKTKIKGLSIGGSAKIIHRIIGGFGKSWGFGLDAGVQYQIKNWQFGCMGRDITHTFNAWSYNLNEKTKEVFASTGNEIPINSIEITSPRIILSSAYTHHFNQQFKLTGITDFNLTFDGMRNVVLKSRYFNTDPLAGLELGYHNIVFLRGGIGNIQKVVSVKGKREYNYQPSIGVGLKLKMIALDYAFTDIGDQSVALYSNVISLRIDINRKPNNK